MKWTVGVLTAGIAAAQMPEPEGAMWRHSMACGANCVYLLLAIAGSDASYEQVLEHVPIDEHGTSLLELQDACVRLGMSYRAMRGTPAVLASSPMPIVVHLEHWTGQVDMLGHFVLLTYYSERHNVVRFLDPITLLPHQVSVDDFRRSWSGHALVPTVDGSSAKLLIVAVCACTLTWFGRRAFAGRAVLKGEP